MKKAGTPKRPAFPVGSQSPELGFGAVKMGGVPLRLGDVVHPEHVAVARAQLFADEQCPYLVVPLRFPRLVLLAQLYPPAVGCRAQRHVDVLLLIGDRVRH
jgi:hypothetical protein